MRKKVPSACVECVATQLILRSVGFISSEFSISLNKGGKQNTDVDLIVQRGDKTELIELGNIKLASKTVLSYWESWLATATAQLIDDFADDKRLFYSTYAYKSMPKLFEHLESKGFELAETEISRTFDK